MDCLKFNLYPYLYEEVQVMFTNEPLFLDIRDFQQKIFFLTPKMLKVSLKAFYYVGKTYFHLFVLKKINKPQALNICYVEQVLLMFLQLPEQCIRI